MFPFSRSRKKTHGQVAIVFTTDGIAYVRMENIAGQTPSCKAFHFSPITSEADIPVVLKQIVQQFNLAGSEVVTTLLDNEASLNMLEKPVVDDTELVQAMQWRVKDMLSYSLDDAVLDVFEIPGQQERGRTPLVYAVAAHRDALKKYVNYFEGQDLQIKSIDIPELVMRNVAALLPEDKNGVALLKLDANQGVITLTQDKSLYLARNLDTGFNSLASKAETTILGEPEQGLSLESESGFTPDQQSALDNIVLEVQRSLDYYESHFAKPAINSLVLSPTPYEIPGMVSYLASALGVQVRMMDLNSMIDLAEPLDDAMQSHLFLAIGAALREEDAVVSNNKSKAA